MMNKLGVVLGAAAIAMVSGCKDPNYIRKNPKAQDTVKDVPVATAPESVLTPDVAPAAPVTPVPAFETTDVPEAVQPPTEPLPGVLPPPPPPPPSAPAVQPVDAAETTPYIVQRGDYLSKISKKFNVKLDALRKANPQLKNDVVKLGQTIQIPGKVDVGAQTVPEGAIAKPAPKAKAEYKPYTGETKEYVVKSGDYLGKIAYANGVTIRQLKELNGLQSDVVRVGQKLRVPATSGAASVAPAPKAEPPKSVAAKPAAPAPAPVVVEEVPVVAEPVVEELPPAAPAPASAPAVSDDTVPYVVQEGEDITAIAIGFGVDPAEIRELNNMGDQDQVKAGQVIKLPQAQ